MGTVMGHLDRWITSIVGAMGEMGEMDGSMDGRLGSSVRWTASLMVMFLVLHVFLVYLTGGFKKPREFTWLTGIVLAVITVFALGNSGRNWGPCITSFTSNQLPGEVRAGTIHVKTGPAERHRGVSGGQFSGLLHFATDRTLSGWTLLFAMGKHTSKEFLYGRKHSRISKCRKTGTKVRSKSGQKWVSRVQSRWVQNDEMSILPSSMVGENLPKNWAKNLPKNWAKNLPNHLPGERGIFKPVPKI
jgi:Cytochrome b/b6/petB